MIDHTKLQGKLRLKILDLHYNANAGHIGCSLSCIDILISILCYAKTPDDTFILSKGHAASALYTVLNETGDISDAQLNSFYKNGTALPAHPAPLKFSGIPFANGSLGHGLPVAVGIAKAKLLKSNDSINFVLMSDGETNEGSTWEAAHFAVAHRLNNLIVVIDKNGLQGFGSTINILGDTASRKIWEEIGFEVAEADGHDVIKMTKIIQDLINRKDKKPKLLIANTVKGKGVSYMENRMEWHYLPMNEAQYLLAKKEITGQYILT